MSLQTIVGFASPRRTKTHLARPHGDKNGWGPQDSVLQLITRPQFEIILTFVRHWLTLEQTEDKLVVVVDHRWKVQTTPFPYKRLNLRTVAQSAW